jgi:alkanesulfonate monooxygenase SsuD/methylene tetrahydromethanopterin reductase-like flavin-dependent oxidoreductase (luciferase family)
MGHVWYDTVATLGWLAAQTESVHLLSHVYVVPYRSPLVTAKAFSTLDVLSGGRAILGVGIGHVEGEFELVGAEFRRRGRDLDAALPILREALETGEHRDALVSPRSPRPGGTPIWVGGSSEAALRRAAHLGDGWLPQGPPKMGMRAAVEFLRTERAERHGADAGFDLGIQSEPIYVGTPPWDSGPLTLSGEPEAIAARLSKYAGVGANHVQVRFAARSADEMAEQITRFGAEVWPLVQS